MVLLAVVKMRWYEAMVNESDCYLVSRSASGLVNYSQGSGAQAIKEIFAKAKAVEADRGVIVLIDELESLSPVTTDKDVKLAHKYSGQD
ncbi:MAG TPA: AAA family ATPase, partial [Candidatus Dependentiae bacterium]|nr:AAA family ATPase [Candidatus Dependentiae bacterium]